MIRCSEAEKFVSLYIDNKLEASQESDFKEHIKTCGSCRKELEEMETLANVCRSMPEIPLPEGFKTQLHEKLRQYDEEKQRQKISILARNRYIKICGTIAACLVLVLLVKGFTGDSFTTLHKTAADRGMEMTQENASHAPNMLMASELQPDDANGGADAAADAGEFNALWANDSLASEDENKTAAPMERIQIDAAAYGGAAYGEPQRNGFSVDRKMASRKITITCENDPDLISSRFNIVKQISADSGADILELSGNNKSFIINLPVSSYNDFINRLYQAVTEKSVEINIADISKPAVNVDTVSGNEAFKEEHASDPDSDSAVLIQIEFICSE